MHTKASLLPGAPGPAPLECDGADALLLQEPRPHGKRGRHPAGRADGALLRRPGGAADAHLGPPWASASPSMTCWRAPSAWASCRSSSASARACTAPGTRRTRSRPYGADAEAFVRGDENCHTPCARGSAWGRLYDRDAYALLVGVELNRMTFFHGVEEWANVPERVDTEHPLRLVIVPPEGPRVIGEFAPHMADSSQLFPKAEDLLLREGAMRKARLATPRCASSPAESPPTFCSASSRTIPSSLECPDPNKNPPRRSLPNPEGAARLLVNILQTFFFVHIPIKYGPYTWRKKKSSKEVETCPRSWLWTMRRASAS